MHGRKPFMIGVISVLCFAACGHDCVDLDITPPGAVADLSVGAITHYSVELAWTAPGDDGLSDRARMYDIRYAIFEITDSSWEDAIRCENEPSPGAPGTEEVFVVSGLSDYTEYTFAIKVGDDGPNWSGLSNVVTCHTAIFDLIEPVIDSISVMCVPPPVPSEGIVVFAHDEAAYPEAVTPPDSLEFWYRLMDPVGALTCESEPEWDYDNQRFDPMPYVTSNGTYVFECKVRDGFHNESELAVAEFDVLR